MKVIPYIVLILIIIELVWSNTLVKSGRQLTQTDGVIAVLREQNQQLAQEVASASALATIAQKAKDIGFLEPTKNQFVILSGTSLPVALAP